MENLPFPWLVPKNCHLILQPSIRPRYLAMKKWPMHCEVTFRPSTPGSTRWLCRSTFATNEGKNASIILNARLRL
jgi:hypothetical protein